MPKEPENLLAAMAALCERCKEKGVADIPKLDGTVWKHSTGKECDAGVLLRRPGYDPYADDTAVPPA